MSNTLASKIAQASVKVGALATDKTNTQQNYSYISADKILERAGDVLAELGIVVNPEIHFEQTTKVDYTDSYGKTKSRYDTIVHFTMVVTDGEQEMKSLWAGRGNDYAVPDKAFYKAITSGHKYYLMKLLNIGVGNEDGEHENGDDDGNAASGLKPTVQAPKPQQTTALPSDDELKIINGWTARTVAEQWSVSEGYCKNVHEAHNSMNNSIAAHGGKVTKENVAAIYLHFLRKHLNRAAA